jgi:predicted SnoaL-like aldol condensation-catalyzing enzyme
MRTFNIAILFLALTLTASLQAEVPVTPHPDQTTLLRSSEPRLAQNKTLVYDFFRVVLRGWHLDRTAEFLAEDYIQHNPNVKTGRQGFIDFFSQISGGRTRPIPAQLEGLVMVSAEGDYVTLAFVDSRKDSVGASYTTTWFDMFRVVNGQIVEHWDNAVKK